MLTVCLNGLADAISIEELDLLYKIPNSCPISAKDWLNIDELTEMMWEKLDLVRIYTKPKGKVPDYSAPVVLRRSRCTVEGKSLRPHSDQFPPLTASPRIDPDFCDAIRTSLNAVTPPSGLHAKFGACCDV